MGFLRNISFLYYGNSHFTKAGYLRAAAKFDNSALSRSLAGKVVAVTGANSGLGLATAHALAARGATLLLLCRNQERGAAAVEAVRAASGNPDVHLEVVDVSSLSSITAFTTSFLASGRPLYALINNAGALLAARERTPEGLDASFAANTLGTLALTQALLPALERGAPSRVVFVSSGGQYTEQLECVDFDNATIQPWDGAAAYARDKRRQVALAQHLAQLWGPRGVCVTSMHPGWADTEGVRTSLPGFHKTFAAKLRSPEQGADTILWLTLEEGSKLVPGAFYLDRTPQPIHLRWAGTSYTPQQVADLYTTLLGKAGLQPTPTPPAGTTAAAAGTTTAAAAGTTTAAAGTAADAGGSSPPPAAAGGAQAGTAAPTQQT